MIVYNTIYGIQNKTTSKNTNHKNSQSLFHQIHQILEALIKRTTFNSLELQTQQTQK